MLFGAHCVLIHPAAVFLAYWKLYGFPVDPRLWLYFLVHDLGYIGRESIDGEGGDEHVELCGRIMDSIAGKRWGDLVRRHSRVWCHRHGQPYSRLCVADKLAFVLTPAWLYLPMVKATGELAEYRAVADGTGGSGKYTEIERCFLQARDTALWLKGLKNYTRRWVGQQRGRHLDAWTAPQTVLKKLILRVCGRRTQADRYLKETV